MPADHAKPKHWRRWWLVLQGKDVLAGLLFMGIAAFGLWVSRGYPVGTASRMGTGYMPRLLLWLLLGLGGSILALGLWKGDLTLKRAEYQRLFASGGIEGLIAELQQQTDRLEGDAGRN